MLGTAAGSGTLETVMSLVQTSDEAESRIQVVSQHLGHLDRQAEEGNHRIFASVRRLIIPWSWNNIYSKTAAFTMHWVFSDAKSVKVTFYAPLQNFTAPEYFSKIDAQIGTLEAVLGLAGVTTAQYGSIQITYDEVAMKPIVTVTDNTILKLFQVLPGEKRSLAQVAQ